MKVASWTGALIDWKQELAAFKAGLAPVFPRRELQETFGLFVDGLLSGIGRKTGWLTAGQAGLERPYGMQSLWGRSRWQAEGLRDAVPRLRDARAWRSGRRSDRGRNGFCQKG